MSTDLWKKAKEKHDQKKKEDEERKGGYEQPLFSKLMPETHATKGYVQVRVLGNPREFRKGDPANGIAPDPTAPKTVYHSWVLSDDLKKKFPVIWPSREEKPDWILYKLVDKVLEGKWNKDTQTKDYHHQATHPDLFKRVLRNNDEPKRTASGDIIQPSGMMGKASIVMNVIDRQRIKEHQEKKHTFLLSKTSESKGTDGKVNEFCETGVPLTVYDSLMSVVGSCGDFNTYDVIVKRTKDKPYYAVYHGTEKLRFIDFSAFNPNTIEAPLTEEELSWERYNIDTLYPVTSYKLLLAKLRQLFNQVDKEFGTKFLDELISLAEIEAKEAPKESTPEVKQESAPIQSTATPAPAPTATRRVATPPAPKAEEPEDPRMASLIEHGYKHADKLTEANLDQIEYVDDAGNIVWADDVGDLFECDACNTQTPGSVSHCPKCGAFFG